MKEQISKTYIADDGKIFTNKTECEKYENVLKTLKAFRIRHGVDLTETGCLRKTSYVLVNSDRNTVDFVNHFCYKTFGNNVDFVQGVYGPNAICNRWTAHPCELTEVETKKIIAKIQPNFVDPIWDENDNLVVKDFA